MIQRPEIKHRASNMHLAADTQQAIYNLQGGMRGTRQTLRLMARLVCDYKTHPLIRNTARELVQGLPGQDYRGEAETLLRFVQNDIRYLQDVNNVETIHAPDVVLQWRAGDCDDSATLYAALLESIGHPARFIAVGFNAPGQFEHVFVETRIGSRWLAGETTIPGAALGWSCLNEREAVSYMRECI